MIDWCRLWHDMPTDPKWRTIARISGQRIGDVIAVYIHFMVDASANATERGRTQSYKNEDIASSLDIEESQVEAIREAMQGRVLDGDRLTGWERRQPKREDGSASRAKEWREKQKAERNRTQPNAEERSDTDKEKSRYREDKEEENKTPIPLSGGEIETPPPKASSKPKKQKNGIKPTNPDWFERFWVEYPRKEDKQDAIKEWNSLNPDEALAQSILGGLRNHKDSNDQWRRDGQKYIPYACRFLKKRRWEDEFSQTPSGVISEVTARNIEIGQRWLEKRRKERDEQG